MKLKHNILVACVFILMNAFADILVSDVEVFSGYPWTEVVVGYTITGTDAEVEADVIQLTAEDKSANKTYTAQSLTGAVLTEGRHILRWNAAAEETKFSSSNVVFSVSIVRLGVRLWANGPYWAECNVGASKPEEYGYYFWWGDTIGYKRNANDDGWVSVLDGGSRSFSGGCPTYRAPISNLQRAGYIDSAGNLVAKYDAATKHLGSRWRMPTDAEWSALVSNCTITRATINGILGRLVTGKGSYATKSIFLPAGGEGRDRYLDDAGAYGYYWSSTPYSDGAGFYECAYCVFLIPDDRLERGAGSRQEGYTVRPVRRFVQ